MELDADGVRPAGWSLAQHTGETKLAADGKQAINFGRSATGAARGSAANTRSLRRLIPSGTTGANRGTGAISDGAILAALRHILPVT